MFYIDGLSLLRMTQTEEEKEEEEADKDTRAVTGGAGADEGANVTIKAQDGVRKTESICLACVEARQS